MEKSVGSSLFDDTPVPLDELVAVCGGSHEATGYWIRQASVTVLEDWQGRSALRFGDARRVFEVWKANREAHDRQWTAYQSWLHARKEAARQQREAEAARVAEEMASARTARQLEMAERSQKRLQEKYRLESERAVAQRPPSFEEFLQSAEGGRS